MSLSNTAITTNTTLVIFCRRPKLNQGKQRLVNDSSAESALCIAKALLECALEDARNWLGPVVLACSEHTDLAWAKSLNINAKILAQLPANQNGNLGVRLNYVDKTLRALGHKELIFIGTDAPMLTTAHYQASIKALQSSKIALSHADDGGVVIMANSVPWPALERLPWSTDTLSFGLLKVCTEHLLSVTYIQPGYDIDFITDLRRLVADLKSDNRPARQALIQTINDLSLFTKVPTYA